MDKIRIGNDVSITWKVAMSSAKGSNSLVKEKLSLYLKNEYELRQITTFSLEDNVICFIYKGEDQKYTGAYTLMLKDEDAGTRWLILENAFGIVLHAIEENGEILPKDENGNYVVKLSGDALTIKDVNEDSGVYARLVAIEEKLRNNRLLTPDEKEIFDTIAGKSDEIETLPEELVTDLNVLIDESKATITVNKVVVEGDDGYQPQIETSEIPSATEEKAGLMSAGDKGKLERAYAKVDISELDNLHDVTYGNTGEPVSYAVTRRGKNIGVLHLISDESSHIVTQVLLTHYNLTSLSHKDDALYTYYRIYNNNSPYASWDKGTWSDWSTYVDGNTKILLEYMQKYIMELQADFKAITSIENETIDEVWG